MSHKLFNAQMAQYATPTITDESSVTVENGVKCYLPELKVDGNTTQQTYIGANILNIPAFKLGSSANNFGWQTSLNGDSITISAENATTRSITFLADGKQTITAGKYKFSVDKLLPFNVRLQKSTFLIPTGKTSLTFTYTGEDFVNASVALDAMPANENSWTVEPITFKLMLQKIDDVAPVDEYEPYVGGIPSPNPEYPQDIINAGDNDVEVEVRGKNLFYQNGSIGQSPGVTCTYNAETQEFTLNGTKTTHGNVVISRNMKLPKLREDRKYQITRYVTGGSMEWGEALDGAYVQMIYSFFKQGSTTSFGRIYEYPTDNNPEVFSGVVTMPADTTEYTVYVQIGGANVYNNWTFKLMLEEYEEQDMGEFEPYVEPQKITIPSSVEVDGEVVDLRFAKIGDYADRLIVDGVNKKVIYQQWNNKKILNEQGAWAINEYALGITGKNYYQYRPDQQSKVNNQGFCNLFPCEHWITNKDNVFSVASPYFIFRTDGIETLDEWLIKLKSFKDNGTPLEVLYTLHSPIEHDITNTSPGEQLLNLIQNNNTTIIKVSNNNNLNQNIRLKYLTHS